MLIAAVVFLIASGRDVIPGGGVVRERSTNSAERLPGLEAETSRKGGHGGKDERFIGLSGLHDEAGDLNEFAAIPIVDAQVHDRKGARADVEHAQREAAVGGPHDLKDAGSPPRNGSTAAFLGTQQLAKTDQRGDETDEDAGPRAPRRETYSRDLHGAKGGRGNLNRRAWTTAGCWATVIALFSIGMIGVRREDGTIARHASLACLLLALLLFNALLLLT